MLRIAESAFTLGLITALMMAYVLKGRSEADLLFIKEEE